MVRWMLERVTPTDAVLEKAYSVASIMWIPAVLNRRLPFGLRWTLLKNALSIDPRAMRRLIAFGPNHGTAKAGQGAPIFAAGV